MPTSQPTETPEHVEEVETVAEAPAEAPGLIVLGSDAGPVCVDGVCQL
ncbi:hypothetical protein [Streptomyces sp. NPDC127098]